MFKMIFTFLKYVLLFFIILFPGSMLFSAKQEIRLGYSDAEAFPFQINHELPAPGIAMEVISEAATMIGLKVVYVRLPNKRVISSLKDGKLVDGAFMFSFNEERRESGVYPMDGDKPDKSKRIATLKYHIYKKKGSKLNWDGKVLSGFDLARGNAIIGANTGYSVVNDLKKIAIEVDEAKTTDQNIKKLQLGRIDGYAQQDLVADNYITVKGITDIEKIPTPFIQKDYFIMFSHQYLKENKDTANKLWQKISEIRDSKTSAVIGKYGN